MYQNHTPTNIYEVRECEQREGISEREEGERRKESGRIEWRQRYDDDDDDDDDDVEGRTRVYFVAAEETSSNASKTNPIFLLREKEESDTTSTPHRRGETERNSVNRDGISNSKHMCITIASLFQDKSVKVHDWYDRNAYETCMFL